MQPVKFLFRLSLYAFALVGIIAAGALAAFVLLMPRPMPDPVLPVDYPAGAYPIGGSAPTYPEDFAKFAPGKPADEPFRLLAISEGGAGGAYGAGLLAASTASADWPDFDIYTGVSVGALLATMAFADKAGSDHLRPLITEIAETIEEDAKRPKVLDLFGILFGRGAQISNDIEAIIRKTIDQDTVARIARRHAAGKRLYVVSVDLTAGSPVLWDIGAIAARPGPGNVARVHQALLASIGVPGVFPSQVVEARGDQTLHIDGAIMRPFYISDHFIKLGRERPIQIHFLVNIKLNSPPVTQAITPRLDAIIHRLLYLTLRTQTDIFLERLLLDKMLFGWSVNVAAIPADTPGIHAIEAMTPQGLATAFDTAYASANAALTENGALGKVWVPLTADVIGRDIPCGPLSQAC
ncbi:hypothetical protein E1180_01540 [Roseibium denhamense]|uniref:Predicted acylesterase/phospholipase RssA, contains patatin domain n=1 Tax=Roseibium denhamense TaxID=76305 RepID=A0ABY1P6W5_9HYPH|nr:patatin-like phospholipase family protein [Roseibium denhamense]MTI04200.1 hypothetical protein [Roseibium denhamense]SMP25505.1 Predicted acylesterase/phospholipase RssA, contains patatin domain [Roseibium denhamense]